MVTFNMEFNTSEDLNVSFDKLDSDINVGLDSNYIGKPSANYKGDYEVTPSDSLQILSTEGKYLSEDIVVAPIPDNYGLITWNGSTLSVT